ncbi:26701_t:CDS:1, partial [Racocetra persica]
ILEKIKKNIYDAMIYYWNVPNEVSLMAALLDPRYKSLDFLENDTEKQQVIQKLRDELGEIEEITSEPNNLPPSNIKTSTRSHKEYFQQRKMRRKKEPPNMQNFDEISNYLSLPSALETENPLSWWK